MRKAIAAASLIAALGMAAALPAGAEMNASSTASNQSHMAVNINPAGRAHLEGTVVSASTSSLVVASWGGNWTVNIGADTKVNAGKTQASSTQIKAGDRVIVNGSIVSGSGLSLNAKTVNDVSLAAAASLVKEARKGVSGVISNLNAAARSFTLTLKNGSQVIVSLANDASLRIGKTVTSTLSGLANGERVNVSGSLDQSNNTLLGSRVIELGSKAKAQNSLHVKVGE